MSEKKELLEGEPPTRNPNERTIKVTMKDGKKMMELQKKNLELQTTLEKIAQVAFDEKVQELMDEYPDVKMLKDIDSPAKLEFARQFLSGTPAKGKSKGSVSMQQGNSDSNIFKREYPDTKAGAQAFAKDLYNEYVTATNPERKAQLESAITKLTKKPMGLTDLPKMMEFDENILENEAKKALGNKFSHSEYTRWLRSKWRKREQT